MPENNTLPFKLPTLINQFKLGAWETLSRSANNTLTHQLTSVKLNYIKNNHPYPNLDKIATLVFEDAKDGTTFNAIQQLQYSPRLIIEIMNGNENAVNYLNLYEVSIESINYELDYALSGTANFVVKLAFARADRTVN